MIKRLLLFAVLVLSLSTMSYSQWTKGSFGTGLDTLKANSGGHGIEVDPAGNVWVVPYRPLVKDTVQVPDSANKWYSTNPVLVYKPDGTPASFSPIKYYTDNGHIVPLWFGANTGIRRDQSGNMVLSQGTTLLKFNYKTGAFMGKYADGAGLTKVAIDKNGNIYVGHTLGALPIKVLDSTLTFVENAVDTLPDIGRTLEVSDDGSTIYAPRYTAGVCYKYTKAGLFEPFKLTDTVFKGWKIEGIGWNRGNKLLYVSGGSYNDKPTGTYGPLQQDKYVTIGTYYGVRTTDYKVIDSLKWQFADATPSATSERNRGIAFSNDGKTAYMVEFNNSAVPFLQKYTNANLPSDVKRENAKVVDNYSLSQNFPNPFNPSTEIKFSIAKDGMVSLKVYDILGKEVATLVNQEMSKGNYSVTLNASTLTSGIYIYQLNTNGILMSRKMTLLK
ncbi:MAG: T9SS type A sorting domain-containing protein [Ignavibacteriales bacterium]